MHPNGIIDPGSAFHPCVIRVVTTAAWPSGLAVRVDFEAGQVMLLPPTDARLIAGGLLDAVAEIERVENSRA
jgi:hypothetical protein